MAYMQGSMFFSFFLPPLLALLLWKLFKKQITKHRNNAVLPPGPRGLPIIGNLHQLGNMPHLSLHNFAQKFGPIMHLQMGQIPTIFISSAEMAKEVTKAHDVALSNRPQFYTAKLFSYNYNDITFSPYGPYWRHVRKICTIELFSAKRVQSFGNFRQDEVARLIRRIGSSYPKPVNVSEKLLLYTNDVICKAAFGRIFSEGGGRYERYGVHSMLEEMRALFGGFGVADCFPALEWINVVTGMKHKVLRIFKQFDMLLDELIQEHLDPNRATYERKDLVDILLDIQMNESFEVPFTMDSIKAIIVDMFAAGTDTSYITLDWGMTELMSNPRVLKKAQEEVRNVMGERQCVMDSDIANMPYLKVVIKEVLRLHPPGPFIPRACSEEIEVKGYKIPPNSRVFINIWEIGRDPACYKDPEIFLPERFIGSTTDYKGQDFELIPFGMGRRMCPGMTFGEASVQLTLAQLLHSFDWELPSGVEPKDLDRTEKFGLTMQRVSNLIAVAKPRFA